MKILLTLLFFVFTFSSLMAQRYYPSGTQSRQRLSIGMGPSAYFGDLQAENTIPKTFNLSLSYEYQLRGRLGVRADGALYQLAASDAEASAIYPYRQERNLSFQSTNAELSGSLVLYLFKNLPAAYLSRPAFNLYGLVGMGLTYYNPKTIYQGNSYRLRDYETEGVSYSKLSPHIPMGMGLQVKIAEQLDMAFEIVYRATFTDYLDDVSTIYPGPEYHSSEIAAILSDRRTELGHEPMKAGSQRGNPEMNDGYAFYNIRLIYYLTGPYFGGADKKKKLIR